jgi:hypothetical protein
MSSPRIISTLSASALETTGALFFDATELRLDALLLLTAGLAMVDAERASPYVYAGYGVVYERNILYTNRTAHSGKSFGL